MNRLLLTILFIATVIFLSNCGRRSLAIKYYVIEPVAATPPVVSNKGYLINAVCEIKQVEIFPAFATNRIAHRNESHEITYYGNHQWAVTPNVELTQILEHALKHKNIFRNVSTRFWKVAPDYILETTVYQLETIQERKTLSAHLNIGFRLIDAATNDVVLTHLADRIKPLDQNNMNLFASAISEMLNDEINNLSLEITRNLVAQQE